MMNSSLNPFTTDAPVKPDRFFGRKALLDAADGFLQHPDEKYFFINGPRRIGKTSFLLKLKDEMARKGFAPVFIDLGGRAGEPLPQVLFDIMIAINAEIKNASGLLIGDFQDDFRVFDRKFLPTISLAYGKTVLLIDEFDVPGDREILREDPAFAQSAYMTFFPYLHSLLGQPAALKCIVAAGRAPSDLRENYEPVKTAACCEHLDGFDMSDITDLVNSLAAGAITFTTAAIEEIHRLAKGRPLFVQCLAGSAFNHAEEQGANEIDRQEIENRLSETAERCGSAISTVVRDILPQERAYLILIAKLRERGLMATEKAIIHEFKQLGMEVAQDDVMRATAGLRDSKILTFNRNFMAYSFYEPVLEKWFVREYTIKGIAAVASAEDGRFDHALRLAKIWYNEKNFAKAVALFRFLAGRYPQRFDAHYGLALALEAEGKSSQAEVIAAFEKAYRFDPDRARRAYKAVLKRAYEEDGASPVLEKLVDLGDSTIEDRKKLLATYSEMWRGEIMEEQFENFLNALRDKPWLLGEYQSEIVRFIDDTINRLADVNAYAARTFVASLKDNIDGVQHRIWQARIEGRLKKANNRTTEIHSIPQEVLALRTAVQERAHAGEQQTREKARAARKRVPVAVAVGIPIGLVLVVLAGVIVFLSSAPSKGKSLPPVPQASFPDRAREEAIPKQLEVPVKQAAVPVAPMGEIQPRIAPAPPNESPARNEARIMLINASSMYQKGLAAKARDKLIKNGFPSPNVLTGNNKDKVSRVYAYYSAKQYVPVLKEVLSVLYPGKQSSFFDISSMERTINGWVKNFFIDEKLHILIRMPNEE